MDTMTGKPARGDVPRVPDDLATAQELIHELAIPRHILRYWWREKKVWSGKRGREIVMSRGEVTRRWRWWQNVRVTATPPPGGWSVEQSESDEKWQNGE